MVYIQSRLKKLDVKVRDLFESIRLSIVAFFTIFIGLIKVEFLKIMGIIKASPQV